MINQMYEREDYWDTIAEKYENLYDKKWDKYEDEVLKSHLEKIFNSKVNPKILDIGCGQGLAFFLLSQTGLKFEYVGLDSSKRMVDKFLKSFSNKSNITVLNGSGKNLNRYFQDNCFDIVISTNSSASFPINTDKLVNDIYKVLKYNGKIYLSFLNKSSLRRLISLKFKSIEHYRTRGDEHNPKSVIANVHNAKSIHGILSEVGFNSISIHYQSVLGGVWESKTSIYLERILIKITPWLGHYININATK